MFKKLAVLLLAVVLVLQTVVPNLVAIANEYNAYETETSYEVEDIPAEEEEVETSIFVDEETPTDALEEAADISETDADQTDKEVQETETAEITSAFDHLEDFGWTREEIELYQILFAENRDLASIVFLKGWFLIDLVEYHELDQALLLIFDEIMEIEQGIWDKQDGIYQGYFSFEEVETFFVAATAAFLNLADEVQVLIDVILDEYGPMSPGGPILPDLPVSWTVEEYETFRVLLSAFRALYLEIRLPFSLIDQIVHYFWVGYDHDIDMLNMVLGMSGAGFTPENIRTLENTVFAIQELTFEFDPIYNDIMSDLFTFDEAMLITTTYKENLLELSLVLNDIFETLVITAWTAEELNTFWMLNEGNTWIYNNVSDLIAIARVFVENSVMLELWFGDQADEYLYLFQDLIVKFEQSELDHDTLLRQIIPNFLITFEEATRLLAENTELMLDIQSQLQNIFADHVQFWTYYEQESFQNILNIANAWHQATENLFAFINHLLAADHETIEQAFGLNPDEILILENMATAFAQSLADFEYVRAKGSAMLIPHDEAMDLLFASLDELSTFFNEFQEFFGMPDWTEDPDVVDDLFATYHETLRELFQLEAFIKSIVTYHELGQEHNLNLVETILLLDITNEEIAALQTLMALVNVVEREFLLARTLIQSGVLTTEMEIALINFNKARILDVINQILEIFGDEVEIGDNHENRLIQLLQEIESLNLNEADFTPESWKVFALAHEEALKVLETMDGIFDIMAMEDAYYHLRVALMALELLEEEPTIPSDPVPTDPEPTEPPTTTLPTEPVPTEPGATQPGATTPPTGGNNNQNLPQTGAVASHTALAGIAIAKMGVVAAFIKKSKRKY